MLRKVSKVPVACRHCSHSHLTLRHTVVSVIVIRRCWSNTGWPGVQVETLECTALFQVTHLGRPVSTSISCSQQLHSTISTSQSRTSGADISNESVAMTLLQYSSKYVILIATVLWLYWMIRVVLGGWYLWHSYDCIWSFSPLCIVHITRVTCSSSAYDLHSHSSGESRESWRDSYQHETISSNMFSVDICCFRVMFLLSHLSDDEEMLLVLAWSHCVMGLGWWWWIIV